MKIHKIKGFADLFVPESSTFTFMENKARSIFSSYGFTELRTPILEYTELFKRSIGEETDVVHKEMYTFSDEKGRSYSLRPEATAGVMRAFIENSIFNKESVSKLFTTGPMFRHERPQKGRFRQFHQINCECLGADSPFCDAELICMLMFFLNNIGIKNTQLQINSLGCPKCRPVFIDNLKQYLKQVSQEDLCSDCQRRMETNPLRVFDCKQEKCKEIVKSAPQISAFLCQDCKEHFDVVLELLQQQNVPYILNPLLVRGLDYYCRTTFEVVSGEIGAQSAIAGGGRYDGLVAMLGGPEIPGIGFACGLERLALLLPEQTQQGLDFYLLALCPEAQKPGFSLAEELRGLGYHGLMNYTLAGFKSSMRQANKSGAKYCLILGSDELARAEIGLKNMQDGTQEQVKLADVVPFFQQHIAATGN